MRHRRSCNQFVRKGSQIFCNVAKSMTKGFAAGASIAGIINTIAPGVIPTFCGYLVGKGFGDILVQCGLVTLGIFAQPSINAVAILGFSGLIGAILRGGFAVAKEICQEVKKKRRRCFEQRKHGD